MTVSDSYPHNEICFGGANNTEHGTAWWDEVRFRATRQDFALNDVDDVALSIEYHQD